MSRATTALWYDPPDYMRTCPSCGSARFYPSRARSFVERFRRIITDKQPYRCHACDCRTWCEIVLPITSGPDAHPHDLRTGVKAPGVSADEIDRIDTS